MNTSEIGLLLGISIIILLLIEVPLFRLMVDKWNFSIEKMLKVSTFSSMLIILIAPIVSLVNYDKYLSYFGIVLVSILWWFTTFISSSCNTVV